MEMEREETRMLVLMTGVLTGEGDEALFERLEDHFLNSGTERALFVLAADLMESDRKTEKKDQMLLDRAEKKLRALTKLYGEQFALFVRGRTLLQGQTHYAPAGGRMGLIRAVLSFLSDVSSEGSDFLLHICDQTAPIRYLPCLVLSDEQRLQRASLFSLKAELAQCKSGVLVPRNVPSRFLPTPFPVATEDEPLGFVFTDADAILSALTQYPEAHGALLASLLGAEKGKTAIFLDAPKTASSYFAKEHSRILSHLHDLCVAVGKGISSAVKRRMSSLALRDAAPLFSFLILLIGSLLGGVFQLPAVILALLFEVYGVTRTQKPDTRMLAGKKILFGIFSLATRLVLWVDALFRVMMKNEKSETAPMTLRDRVFLDDYILRFSPSMMVGLFFFFLRGIVPKLFGLLWMIAPFYYFLLSREKRKRPPLCAGDTKRLLRYAEDMWRFFEAESTQMGLLPMRVQLSPSAETEAVTSPSAMGLTLVSFLSALELGFLSREAFCERSLRLLETISSLARWNGHLFSRYHLASGKPNGLVLAEESALFFTSLAVFAEGIRELGGADGDMSALLILSEQLLSSMELSVFCDEDTRHFYAGYDMVKGAFTEGNEESRLLSFLAIGDKTSWTVPCGCVTGSAWKDFLPHLFMGAPRGSSAEKLMKVAFRLQKKHGVHRAFSGKRACFFGSSESAYYAFDSEMRYLTAEHRVGDEVIAPYASFLMLPVAAEKAMANLERLEALGLYGKYGFYDAVDLAPSRVGEGYGKAEVYSAVHLGASFASAADLLLSGRLKERLLQTPKLRANREWIAADFTLETYKKVPKKSAEGGEKAVFSPSKTEKNSSFSLLHPEISLLSNNQTRLFLSSSGHLLMQNGKDTLLPSSFDLYHLQDGLRLYIKTDETILATVPLEASSAEVRSEFTFYPHPNHVLFRGTHRFGGRCMETFLRFSVEPTRALVNVTVSLRGGGSATSLFLFFSPFSEKSEMIFHREESIFMLREEKKSGKRLFGIFMKNATWESLPAAAFQREEAYIAYCREEMSVLELKKEEKLLYALCCTDRVLPKGELSFSFGTEEDEEELLYRLLPRAEKGNGSFMKQGELLQLQYRAAGLSFPPSVYERGILRALFFGQLRPRTESLARFDGVVLRRMGLSAEIPILLAEGFCDAEMQIRNLRALIAIFKYMCIRGVRYALVILYQGEASRGCMEKAVKAAGCEEFLSYSKGIFLVDGSRLTKEEHFAFSLAASCVLDLGLSLDWQLPRDLRAIPLSSAVQGRLTRDALRLSDSGREGRISSRHLASVLSQRTLGDTFFLGHERGKLTERGGELLLLRLYDGTGGQEYRDYDLAGCAEGTHFFEDQVLFSGTAEGIRFVLRVSLHELEKRFEIMLQSETAVSAALLFCVHPVIGTEAAPPRFYRFRRVGETLHVTRFSDKAVSFGLRLSASLPCTIYTELAAVRSDGAVCRGEEDLAALAVHESFSGEWRCKFSLSAENG